ncbi:hypothetical protein [Rhodopseudomonas palustris]|uniref:SinR family protein n=1 Tax=Rhodopseudomonas palustris TaxID=1076 RepID=A0A418V1B1_RHOPL|nr:hypothetical protein [Rhodopseudomonas palustris]RJF69607.1 hypothetical protein D4Q52_19835 [Rhodopseudomonas palustris]
MSIFLVTWDLNKQKLNYAQARQALIDHLSRYPHIYDQGLDSVWFLETSASADTLSADIRTKLDNNDTLIVTKLLPGQHQGWLSKETWNWINPRL